MPNPEEFRKKIDAAAQKMGLNEKQIKALYVLNGVESRSGTATENSYANTTADRIRKVFGAGSAIGKLSDSEIDKLKKDDEAFFNKAYGHKLDNEGEGYKYRGRGGVQLTGKSNYKKLTEILNKNGVDIDLVKNPDLAADPRYSADILVSFADKEGMFTEGSDKYLSDSDLDKIAQGDASAIDRLHNVTNSKADNEHITKVAKEVYANTDGSYDVSNMSDGGKSPSGGDESTINTEAFRVAEEKRQAKGWASLDKKQQDKLSKAGITEKTTKEEAANIVKESGRPNFLDVTDNERKQIKNWLDAGAKPLDAPEIKGKTTQDLIDFGKNGPISKDGARTKQESNLADTRSDFTRKQAPKIKEKDSDGVAKQGDGVRDMKPSSTDDSKNTGTIEDIDVDKLKQQIADNKELMSGLANQEEYNHIPAKFDNDLGGTIADGARGVMGLIGASKELPVYERGEMFQTSMDELTQRRNMGLSADEIGFAKQMAERGYGYDVKNIRRMAGGSAGVALGNLGRAQGQLYDEYGKLAVRDEGVRRQNRSDFNRGALSDEQVNRQIFTDELTQAERTKMSAAGLTQDAFKNMRDRSQYNKAYGPGSQIFKYQDELMQDMGQSRVDMRNSNAQRKLEATQDFKRQNYDLEKQLLESTGGLSENVKLGGESPLIEKAGQSFDYDGKRKELQRMLDGNLISEDDYLRFSGDLQKEADALTEEETKNAPWRR